MAVDWSQFTPVAVKGATTPTQPSVSATPVSAASTVDWSQFEPVQPIDSGAQSRHPMFVAGPAPPGMTQIGNIDIANRPVAHNPDGTISTVRSISIGTDDGEVLIPTVSPDGKVLTDKQAIDLYRKTGQNLGVFDSVPTANAYAEALHEQQAKMYAADDSGKVDWSQFTPLQPLGNGNVPPGAIRVPVSAPKPALTLADVVDAIKHPTAAKWGTLSDTASALGHQFVGGVGDVLDNAASLAERAIGSDAHLAPPVAGAELLGGLAKDYAGKQPDQLSGIGPQVAGSAARFVPQLAPILIAPEADVPTAAELAPRIAVKLAEKSPALGKLFEAVAGTPLRAAGALPQATAMSAVQAGGQPNESVGDFARSVAENAAAFGIPGGVTDSRIGNALIGGAGGVGANEALSRMNGQAPSLSSDIAMGLMGAAGGAVHAPPGSEPVRAADTAAPTRPIEPTKPGESAKTAETPIKPTPSKTEQGAAHAAPSESSASANPTISGEPGPQRSTIPPNLPAEHLAGVSPGDRLALSAMYARDDAEAEGLLKAAKSVGAHQTTIDAVKDARRNVPEPMNTGDVQDNATQAVLEGRQPGTPSHVWGPLQTADVGLAGGAKKDLSGGYLDRNVPRTVEVDGKTIPTEPAIRLHENVESHLMHELGFGYQSAHAIATARENAFIRSQYGVNPDAYQKALTDGIDAAREGAPGGNVPPDLDAKPYTDSGTEHLLPEDHFEDTAQTLSDAQRSDDAQALRSQQARFASTDHGEALTVAQWAARAREAGMTTADVEAVANAGTTAERIAKLSQAIQERTGHGTQRASVPLDRSGDVQVAGAGQDAPRVQEGGRTEGAAATGLPARKATGERGPASGTPVEPGGEAVRADDAVAGGTQPDRGAGLRAEAGQRAAEGDQAATVGAGTDTGIKNAQTKAEREARGLDEINVQGRRQFGEVWDRAQQALKDDSHAGRTLADAISAKPRPLSAEESAILILDRARIQNTRRAAERDVADAIQNGDMVAEAQARVRMDDADKQLEANDEAARKSGYEQGLGLAMRRAMAREDYSLAAMKNRMQAKLGRTLNDKELAQIEDLHRQLQEKDDQIAALQAKGARRKPVAAKAAKTAEQRFADLAERLRKLHERETSMASEGNVHEVAEQDLSPQDRELVRQVRERAASAKDNRAASDQLQQESVERGEREAGELGLRGAVVEALGPERMHNVHFVHDEDGLPPDVRARGTSIKRGNVRYGLHTSDGHSYIFTKTANTPERATWTAIHEVGGHGGVQEIVNAHPDVKIGGRTVAQAYESARKLFLQNPTVRKLAEVIGKQRGSKDLPRMAEEAMAELQAAARTGRWDEIANKYGVDVPNGVREGVKSAMANFVRRLKAIVSVIHAKLTGKPNAFTDADVHDMLNRMWEASQGEHDEGGGGEHLASEERDTNDDVATNKNVAGNQGPRAAGGESRRDAATGLPLNGDGTVTVYHHTSPEAAAEIRRTGVLHADAEPDVYVTTRAETDTGYGDAAVPIHVDPRKLQLDDEFPNGRRDFRLSVGRPGGSIKVRVSNDHIAPDRAGAGSNESSEEPVQVEPEAKRIIRGMAQELVNAGYTDANDIVDRIHDTIREHTPMSKDQLADVISGYGQKPKPTKDMLRMRMNALRAELRQASKQRDIAAGKVPGPDVTRNRTRQKQLTQQIEELKARIASGDFDARERALPSAYNAATNKLLVERNQLRRKFDRMSEQSTYKASGKTNKIISTALAFRRAVLLSSVRTIGKLTAASAYRIALQPIEHAVQGTLGLLPGIRGIAKRAPTEGRFSPGAEWEALRKTFSRETGSEMLRKLMHGEGSYDIQFGKRQYSALHPWLSMVAHVHAFLHTPAEHNEYVRATRMWTDFEVKRAIESGMTPEQAMEHMADPMTEGMINMRGYESSQRAIFFNKNFIVNGFHALEGALRNAGAEGSTERAFGRGAANTLEYMFPIVKVPSNFAGEVASYGLGAAKAAMQLIAAKGVKHLTPEQADYIMRNLGKQTLGAIVAAIGWYGYKQVGSFYQVNDNKRHNIPEEGSAWGIPKWAIDTPVGMMLTIGATMHRISDGIPKRSGGFVKGTGTLGEGIRASAVGTAEEVPFFNEFGHLSDSFQSNRSMAVNAGKQASDFIVPPDVRRMAAAMDNHTPRKPGTFLQALEMSIPGLRQHVPVNPRR